jgi:hypothetical protein
MESLSANRRLTGRVGAAGGWVTLEGKGMCGDDHGRSDGGVRVTCTIRDFSAAASRIGVRVARPADVLKER